MLNVCLSPKPTNYEAVYFYFWDIADFMIDFDGIRLRRALCCASLCCYAELFVADTVRKVDLQTKEYNREAELGPPPQLGLYERLLSDMHFCKHPEMHSLRI
jgi:hypothetical protein